MNLKSFARPHFARPHSPKLLSLGFCFCLLPSAFCLGQIDLPFGIAPYQKVDAVVKQLKSKAIESDQTKNEEGGQEIRAYKVEWKDIEFDTLIVSFTGEPEEASAISLVRVCEDDEVDKATDKLIEDMTQLYGAPSEDAIIYALWSRGSRQTIFLGRREDDQSVCAAIDIESMVYRRASTMPDWPYDIPIDAPRDEIEKTITKACGKLIAKEEMFVATAGCNCMGIQSRRMTIWNDEAGLITSVEARFDAKKESEVRDAIVKRYGPHTSIVDEETKWHFAGPTDAVKIQREGEDLIVFIDVLALERKQYSN